MAEKTKSGNNIRCREFMNHLGLGDRMLTTDITPDIDVKSDWSFVDIKLKEEREKSLNYLLSIN